MPITMSKANNGSRPEMLFHRKITPAKKNNGTSVPNVKIYMVSKVCWITYSHLEANKPPKSSNVEKPVAKKRKNDSIVFLFFISAKIEINVNKL